MPAHPDQSPVAVVGGGLTGLTLGLALVRAGVAAVVVDHALAPGTRTGLMAGLATAHQELQHHHVWRWFGDAAVKRYAAEVARGQQQVLAHAAELGVRVHRRPTATVTADGHEAFWLHYEARAERRCGIEPTFTDTTGLPMATRPQLICDDQPSLDVVAYRDGLREAFLAAGGEIVSTLPGHVSRRVSTTPDPVGAPPAMRLRLQTTTWHWLAFDAPHPTGRDTFHLDDGGRIVTTVGDELWVGSRRDDGTAWVARHYDEPTITEAWTAPASATFDALPLVGPQGDDLIACGFGPWELTLGTAAALQLADVLTGASSDLPWSPRRLPRAAAIGRAAWGASRKAMRINPVTPFPRRG